MNFLITIIIYLSFTGFLLGDNGVKTVCLNMIVKNESAIIERCLSSVKPFIDYWVIVDTGSTDETKEIIQNFLQDVPGTLHERSWINFEENRNQALSLAQGKADYILFIDADEELIFSTLPDKTLLTQDFYYIVSKYFGMNYKRVQLVQASLDWRWQGVIHETLKSSLAHSNATLEGVFNKVLPEGNRSKDPEKYIKDAHLLEQALIKDPFNTRYTFYLAQSYKDAGLYDLAIQTYFKRISLGGFSEEVFWSLYQIAILQELSNQPSSIFIQSYKIALNHSPLRIEPLYRLINYYRRQSNFLTAYELSLSFPKNTQSSPVLFEETWMHEYGLLLEKAFCALKLNNYLEANLIYNHLLAQDSLPLEIQSHIKHNLSIIDQIQVAPTKIL